MATKTKTKLKAPTKKQGPTKRQTAQSTQKQKPKDNPTDSEDFSDAKPTHSQHRKHTKILVADEVETADDEPEVVIHIV